MDVSYSINNTLTPDPDITSIQQLRVKKQSFTFSNCKICNDKATGVHYGITTCEGCKGFFKRNIQRSTYYQCFFGNNCNLTPRTRNRCKACRFRRCIEVGMSFDGIKMGRIPKAVKKLALETKDLNKKSNIIGQNQINLNSSSSEMNESSPNSSPIRHKSPKHYGENTDYVFIKQERRSPSPISVSSRYCHISVSLIKPKF